LAALRPLLVDSSSIETRLSACIGVTMCQQDDDDAQPLIARADHAMRKNRLIFYANGAGSPGASPWPNHGFGNGPHK